MLLKLNGREAEVTVVVSGDPDDCYVDSGYWVDAEDAALNEAECQAIGDEHPEALYECWLDHQIDRAEAYADAARDGSDYV